METGKTKGPACDRANNDQSFDLWSQANFSRLWLPFSSSLMPMFCRCVSIVRIEDPRRGSCRQSIASKQAEI